jgi:hypothetical protein
MEFTLSRFWLLTSKQWVENRKLYVLGALALTGILSFFILFSVVSEKNLGFSLSLQRVVFFIGLISAGALFSSTLLKSYEEKQKSIQAFMLPASIVEKFLVAILYSMIFFPLAYFMIAYPLILLGLYIDVEILGRFNLLYTFNDGNLFTLLFIFFVIQSCFLLFSVVFHRYAFLKTVVLISVLLMSCFFSNDYMVNEMLGDSQPNVLPEGNFVQTEIFAEDKGPHRFSFSNASPYAGMTVISSGKINEWEVKLPKNKDAFFKLYLICIAPMIWLIAFLRLREKQLSTFAG